MRAVATNVTDLPIAHDHLYAASVVAIARARCEDNLVHCFDPSVYGHDDARRLLDSAPDKPALTA